MLALTILAGCLRAPTLPPVEAPPPPPPQPTEPGALWAWMLGSDPLARRPRLPTGELPTPEHAAYVAVASTDTAGPGEFRALEAAHRRTLVVPFARGARLAAMEVAGDDPGGVLDALLPFGPPDAAAPRQRDPMAWAGVVSPRDLLPAGERAVLLGWMTDPATPPALAAELLERPEWDRLLQTPAGQLVHAAGRGVRDAEAGDRGRRTLAEATAYAALRAAADRPTEQAAVKKAKAELGPKYGVDGDPLGAMLRSAEKDLLLDAAEARSAGLALVAISAERLNRSCPDAPCAGFDRVAALRDAGAWHPDANALGMAWEAIALKDAVDHLEVAYDEPSFPSALDGLVEALTTGPVAPFDRSILTQAAPGPGVHLAICRALGAGDLTSRAAMTSAIDRELAKRASSAWTLVDPGTPVGQSLPYVEDLRGSLKRIASRANAGPDPAPGAGPR